MNLREERKKRILCNTLHSRALRWVICELAVSDTDSRNICDIKHKHKHWKGKVKNRNVNISFIQRTEPRCGANDDDK